MNANVKVAAKPANRSDGPTGNDSFRNVARERDLSVRLVSSACTSVASFRCAAVEQL
jgi:hypothetical protein